MKVKSGKDRRSPLSYLHSLLAPTFVEKAARNRSSFGNLVLNGMPFYIASYTKNFDKLLSGLTICENQCIPLEQVFRETGLLSVSVLG